MKFCRDINYDDFGITEDNGWKPSYDWSKLRKTMKRLDIIVTALISIISVTLVLTVFEEYQGIYILLNAGISVILFLFVITPIHEILHLIPMVGLKLDDKCYIFLGKGTVSAFYKGEISNMQNCISLITPFIILGLILTLSIFLLPDIFKLCTTLLLLMHIGGSSRDVYMFFYMKKYFPKNAVFFGNRYRTK